MVRHRGEGRCSPHAPDGNGPAESVSDMDDEAKESSAVVTNMNAGMKPEVGLVKAKGGRPKDPIWNEFSTNDDLRKRRYCMCIWCEKEVKGDTTRMTAHVLERCTVVDALTKAKYTVKFRKLHNDSTRVDHGDVLSSISATSTLSTSPTISKGDPPTAATADVTALVPAPASPSLQHSTYPILHAESPPGLTLSKFGFLKELGLQDENRGVFGGGDWFGKGSVVTVVNPSTNESIATIQCGTMDDYMHVVETMDVAAITWRQASMERRSAVVHQIGDAFRSHQRSLAHLVSMELGIVLDESMRHIDMMIHTCDSAATAVRAIPVSTVQEPTEQSRNERCTKTLVFERHVPLAGHVGLLTPFHAPMWTGAMALACGNAVLWKPSLMLTSIAITHLISAVLARNGFHPGCASLVCGSGREIGTCLAKDKRMAVVRYKGCVDHGHRVGMAVAERMGRSVLDLDTQNAVVVHADADVDHAVRMIVKAMGRRILRRVYTHVDVCDRFRRLLSLHYREVVVGDPFQASTACGPLRNCHAVQAFTNTINAMIPMSYGQIICGGSVLDQPGNFVAPTAVLINDLLSNVQMDALSPITFVSTFHNLNQVMVERQPLERIILFTQSSLAAAFEFTGANVIGVNCDVPSDIAMSGTSWTTYMRRTTCTVNMTPTDNQEHSPSTHLMDPSTQITSLHVL
ncbi:hypothetical protein, variant 1 [Aphanomyces invadans]|uniref:Aldehyde dehydrogenase domain-containing protein n=1 Tax=Aphanomyces invadans TaxID=157072 RepID=A0A024UNY5_9STRA|nr:hypothetical protein, variant 1 [Aphanomyces invadans]ETW07885.1 hypothetical protein, variant 1 [Aphanomyces invadans]|eukprot:XP_008863978.1 hypothetical protein, variant 1 [Aphanomyces invadans]